MLDRVQAFQFSSVVLLLKVTTPLDKDGTLNLSTCGRPCLRCDRAVNSSDYNKPLNYERPGDTYKTNKAEEIQITVEPQL